VFDILCCQLAAGSIFLSRSHINLASFLSCLVECPSFARISFVAIVKSAIFRAICFDNEVGITTSWYFTFGAKLDHATNYEFATNKIKMKNGIAYFVFHRTVWVEHWKIFWSKIKHILRRTCLPVFPAVSPWSCLAFLRSITPVNISARCCS
jgi:hypothetical protein